MCAIAERRSGAAISSHDPCRAMANGGRKAGLQIPGRFQVGHVSGRAGALQQLARFNNRCRWLKVEAVSSPTLTWSSLVTSGAANCSTAHSVSRLHALPARDQAMTMPELRLADWRAARHTGAGVYPRHRRVSGPVHRPAYPPPGPGRRTQPAPGSPPGVRPRGPGPGQPLPGTLRSRSGAGRCTNQPSPRARSDISATAGADVPSARPDPRLRRPKWVWH